jgi:Asp-tRNA(Asn)/Glu-tRNA(Gln) amidotransferase A subunit family amidase
MQLIAPAFAEDKLLQAARRYEMETNWHKNRPQL